MISLLFVDDDVLFVERTTRAVHIDAIGIDTVLTAHSMLQALEIMEKAPVDILLADIEMPQGSGLELLTEVRARGYDTECIFLSSYAQFSYAQMAISLGSINYLLKPIAIGVLEAELARAAESVRQRRSTLDTPETPALFWESLLFSDARPGAEAAPSLSGAADPSSEAAPSLSGAADPSSEASPSSAAASASAAEPAFVAAHSEPGDAAAEGTADLSGMAYVPGAPARLILLRLVPAGTRLPDPSLTKLATQNVAAGLIEGRPEQLLAVVTEGTDQWIALRLSEVSEWADNQNGGVVSAAVSHLAEALGCPVCLYVSAAGTEGELPALRQRLLRLAGTFVPADRPYIIESGADRRMQPYPVFPWAEWRSRILSADQIRAVHQELVSALHTLSKDGYLLSENLGLFRGDLMQLIYHYFDRKDLAVNVVFDPPEMDVYYKEAVRSMQAMEAFLSWLFDRLFGLTQQDNKYDTIVNRLRLYIDEHLSEELSRETLASTVYLSEDYMSKIFSRITGTSLMTYISDRRMERAKEYLVATDDPVSRIALSVGFTNFSYFSKMFRSYTGYTPNEFRSRLRREG